MELNPSSALATKYGERFSLLTAQHLGDHGGIPRSIPILGITSAMDEELAATALLSWGDSCSHRGTVTASRAGRRRTGMKDKCSYAQTGGTVIPGYITSYQKQPFARIFPAPAITVALF